MSTSALPEDLSQHLSTITLPLPTDLAALFQKRSSLENDLASFEALSIEGDVKDVKELDQLFASRESSPTSTSSTAQEQNNSTSTQVSIAAPSTTPATSTSISTEKISKEASRKAQVPLPKDREGLTEKLKLLNELIIKREGEMRESDTPLLRKGLSMNEKGEMLNEEGLPFVGINFEEDEPYIPRRPPSPKPTLPSASTSTSSSTNEAPKVRVGGLIQRNGKQTLLKSKVITPSTPTPSSSSLPPSKSEAMNKKFAFTPENEAILARFEREEQEEAEAEDLRAKLESTTLESASVSSTNTPSAATSKSNTIIPPKKALSGFSSGFLNKKPKLSTPIASKSTLPSILLPASTSKISTLTLDDSEPRHEPLHHILPPSKSIYRPTPPSSLPNTRPSSPRPSDKKVVFNLPEGVEESIPKSKKGKEVIILGGPEPLEDDSTPVITKKEPAQRPLREVVVERPIKPPSESRMRPSTRFTKEEGDGLPIRTLGMAPKSTASAFRSPFTEPTPPSTSTSSTSTSTSTSKPTSSTTATPIHTLSLSSTSNSLPSGHLSIANYEPEDQESDSDEHSASELRPSLTSDGSESSDSSGFYGSDFDEDEEDDDEIDIDGALHNREVALEYHRLRMNVGAGAGTGPLGGELDPESYDSWNQENVPTSANQQGRTPGSHSSRFRTGRLESAQMIIPSLLQEHIRTNIDQDSDEEGVDDGLTSVERQNLRNTLAELAGRSSTGGRSDMEGRRTEPQVAPTQPPTINIASNSISQMMEEPVPSRPVPSDRIGQRMATPIALPSNSPLSRMREEKLEEQKEVPEAAAPVKKMSRFKARQMGLEPEVQN